MATIFIHKVMSLDGFISKPDEMDYAWMFAYGSGGEMPNRMMGEVGAVIQGNKGFRDGTLSEETLPYGGKDAAQFIVTHDSREPVVLGGLVDEIVIHLAPVILGEGISLFDHLGTEIELKREEVDVTDQVTSLRFSVVRSEG